MMWIECDEIVSAWIKEHPDKDMGTEGFRIDIKRRIIQSSEGKAK